MEVINIYVMTWSTVLFSRFLDITAYMPDGYIGCYDKRTLPVVYQIKSAGNTGDKCKSVCSGQGLRYAGTQNILCVCGDRLRDEYSTAKKCYVDCPGNRAERCGGLYRQMSFYEISETTTPTIKPTKRVTATPTPTGGVLITTISKKARQDSSTFNTDVQSPHTDIAPFTMTVTSKSKIWNSSSFEKSSATQMVPKEQHVSQDGEQSVHTVIVISVPVTVAIIGIIAVAIFRIYRKTRPKRGQTDREHNKPKETVEGERGVAVAEDNESVHIYAECDAVYHSNKDYLTPSMTTSQSFDNTDYLLPTPKSTKSKWQPGSVGSLPRASGKDCSGVPDKEERCCNQYESVLPKCGNSENHYEKLQKELNTKAHKSFELYEYV